MGFAGGTTAWLNDNVDIAMEEFAVVAAFMVDLIELGAETMVSESSLTIICVLPLAITHTPTLAITHTLVHICLAGKLSLIHI